MEPLIRNLTCQYKIEELNGDSLTPITVFTRLNGRKKFLMESSLKHEEKGKYSFVGMNPYKELVTNGDKVTIIAHEREKQVETLTGDVLQIIKNELPSVQLPVSSPFYGGAVGYISYDLIHQYKDIGLENEDDIQMPDTHLMVFQDTVIFDHEKQTFIICALDLDGTRNEQALQQSIANIKHHIFTPVKEEEKIEAINDMTFHSATGKQTFLHMVEKAKAYIENGDIYQIVLSQRMQTSFEADPFSFYRCLRRANPSPYMFYIDFEDYIVLGASPESLITINNREIVTNPIAGTRSRGKTKTEDKQLENDLLTDEKEIAEHNMLVDLSRNDLGSICIAGSITVPTYMTIERYKHVMHIVTEVHGTLKEDVTWTDALLACLPAGTISGAPKIRAMQILHQLEKKKRGVYGGVVGYVNVNGDVNFVLAIRTLVLKDNTAYVQAGAGIVYDSKPEEEFAETMFKAKALLEVNNE